MVSIDLQACDGCGLCVDSCPTGALKLVGDLIQVDNSLCEGCYSCVDVCPQEALVPCEIVEENDHIPAITNPYVNVDKAEIYDTVDKPLARPAVMDLGPPRRSLGERLGSALEFLVFELGPAVEGILRIDSRRKGDDRVSFYRTEKSQSEKRGGRGSGRKVRRRRHGRR
jgi:ferredoxin